MTEKTLIIVIAETRAHEVTYDYFQRNLVSVFNADIALCVGDNSREDQGNFFYQSAKYVWRLHENTDWGAVFDKICADGSLVPGWRVLLQLKGILFGGVKEAEGQPGTCAIGLVFRAFLKQCLVESGVIDSYDRFIITRSDYLHLAPHLPPQLLNLNYIWIPDGEHYGGVTDRHVVCSKNDLLGYLGVVDEMFFDPEGLWNVMDREVEWNIEKYIKFQLERNGLYNKVRFYPFTMFTVRLSDGHTGWSGGEYNDKLNVYVKYKNEYLRSSMARIALFGSKKWSAAAKVRYKIITYMFYKVYCAINKQH